MMNNTPNLPAPTFIALITSNIVYLVVIAYVLYSAMSAVGVIDLLNDPNSDLVILQARRLSVIVVIINNMYRKYSVSQLTGNDAGYHMSVVQKRSAPSLQKKILIIAILESSSIYTLVISLLLIYRPSQAVVSDMFMISVVRAIFCIVSNRYSYNVAKSFFSSYTQAELQTLDAVPADNTTTIGKAVGKMIMQLALSDIPVVALLGYVLFVIYN